MKNKRVYCQFRHFLKFGVTMSSVFYVLRITQARSARNNGHTHTSHMIMCVSWVCEITHTRDDFVLSGYIMSKTSFVTHANCLFVQNVAYPTPGDCTIFIYAVFNICALHKSAAPGNGDHAVRNATQCGLNRKSRGLFTSFFLGHLTCRSFSSYYFLVSFVYCFLFTW